MKGLRKILDKIKPNFRKGGKFEKFESTFDAFETFLFVSDKVTKKGAHIRDAIDMKRTMSVVVIALMPALLFGMYNIGYQYFSSIGQAAGFFEMFWFGLLKMLPIIIVSYVSGLAVEFIFAQVRHHEVNEGFLVTGMLIPLVMPPDVPLWIVAVATIFAVIIGKEAFGGTGMNILNPALLARAFIFFAYPSKISGDLPWVSGLASGQGVVDGFSGATALSHAAQGAIEKIPDNFTLFMGLIPGSIGETSKLAILLGAGILLISGIGNWRIMFSVVIGGIIMSLLFNLIGANAYMGVSPLTHLLLGGFLFGAVFMATDPVTAAQTNNGKIIYGLLIGMFAILLRVLNPAYPEGMMLAILLMNVFAPLIDHYVVQANIRRRMKRVTISKS
ncbi:MAG: NADH:ubiquinone reductase (Na(+)-transporting) subunit B [Bacteroidetes bacterium RIFOXYA12_FULL_35_11]|nr:MAG: NADH:ubiquinone reductase (Na(+)-transporting) subunit B [Bacteroidetes bacterium GWF2_35_48]OFY73871.1 MAG: NADH:ubiquinone reductase (Na(+)-transporting) subunit B [Bacteroidetes bacterium RIFOXYA12_FULL_35_11]OFY92882.1 MAG: NADH:ubiquinone reductase (Na(+)-transporting) subunit B [Bacteroidetes bacterium RIFOXYC12_FULL_35_7]OFY97791.1 MAG: NADH:ubiquinone reductase (Na(+)-transporting) subunit B [Bacteroidetes bacterium RIFOXYB2_FULL_35_7]HBX53123.1 NADH:ubiquinone reductase (Na(+)-